MHTLKVWAESLLIYGNSEDSFETGIRAFVAKAGELVSIENRFFSMLVDGDRRQGRLS